LFTVAVPAEIEKSDIEGGDQVATRTEYGDLPSPNLSVEQTVERNESGLRACPYRKPKTGYVTPRIG
jgi:hypothetical protein